MPYDLQLPDGNIIAGIPDDVEPDRAVEDVGKRDPGVAKFVKKASLGETIASLPGRAAAGIASVIPNVERMLTESQAQNLEEGGIAELARKYPNAPFAKEALETEASAREARGVQEEATKALTAARPQRPEGMLGRVLGGTAESIGPTLGALAVGIGTRSPTLAVGTMFPAEAGGVYAENIAKGAAPQEAASSAMFGGSVGALTEKIPLAALFKEGVPFGRKLLEVAVKEFGQEAGTAIVQKYEQRVRFEPDKPHAEIWQEVLEEGLSGALGAGVTTPIVQLAQRDNAPITGGNTSTEPSPSITPPAETPPPPVPPTPATSTPTPPPDIGPVAPDLIQAEVVLEQIDQAIRAGTPIPVPADSSIPQPSGPGTESGNAIFDDFDSVNRPPDAAELAGSRAYADNAVNYPNPNTGNRGDRNILIGPEGTVGVRARDVDWTAIGPTTVVLGQESLDRPDWFLKSVRNVIEALRATFTPNTTVVLVNEALPNAAGIGWHYRGVNNTQFIVPGVVRRISQLGTERFNFQQQIKAFYNIFHEFGHVIVEERFAEGLDPETRRRMLNQANSISLDPALVEQIRMVNPESAAVIDAWQSAVTRIMDGSMTAGEFFYTWMSPSKIFHKTYLEQFQATETTPARDFIRNIIWEVMRREKGLDYNATMNSLIDARVRQYLSLHEYLAEQTARAAHAKGASSKITRFFTEALASLRAYFRELKKGMKDANGTVYSLAPGTEFNKWLESLGSMSKALEGVKGESPPVRVNRTKEKEAKKAKATKSLDKALGKPGEKPMTTEQSDMMGLLAVVSQPGALRDEIQDLIRRGRTVEASAKMADAMEGKIHWEVDPEGREFSLDSLIASGLSEQDAKNPKVLAASREEFRREGTMSRFFRAWFGEWKDRPDEASKVISANGVPMVLFHYSPAHNFGVFDRGDLGFHFGVIGAAQTRQSHIEDWLNKQAESSNTPPVNGQIRPFFLNVRNPLDLGSEGDGLIWSDPRFFGIELFNRGLISQAELDVIHADYAEFEQNADYRQSHARLRYLQFAEVRRLLREKGYDGIRYVNEVEGGVSWVVFSPEQAKLAGGINTTFSKSRDVHWETDFDLSTPEGQGAGDMLAKAKRMGLQLPWLRAALGWSARFNVHMLQGQQLVHLNPDHVPLRERQASSSSMEQQKNVLQMLPEATLKKLAKFSKENIARIQKVLEDEVAGGAHVLTTLNPIGRGEYEHLPAPALHEALTKAKIPADLLDEVGQVIVDYKNSLAQKLNYAQKVLAGLYIAKNQSRQNAQAIANAVQENIYAVFRALHLTPFVPESRYGDYAVVVRQKQQGHWKTIYRAQFESYLAGEKEFIKLRKRLHGQGDFEVLPVTRIPEHVGVLVNLPAEFVEQVAETLELTAGETDILRQLMQPNRTDKVVAKFTHRLAGASRDFVRNYADYSWHMANMLVKMEYSGKFAEEQRHARQFTELARRIDDPVQAFLEEKRMVALEKWMDRNRQYMLYPPNELQRWRTFVALTYLWASTKTALLNFASFVSSVNQLELAMEEKYGLAAPAVTVKIIGRAVKEATNSFFGKATPELQRNIDEAVAVGLLNESYAFHLANQATQGTLLRMYAASPIGKLSHHVIVGGMLPFRAVELGTRRLAFIVSLLEGQEKGLTGQDAFQYAYRQTKLLQNSYTRFDTPDFMRGKVALLTVFYSFTQFMAFHTLGGYELGQRRSARLRGESPRNLFGGYTMRLLLLMLLLGGYEALPGAEDLLDLLDPAVRRLYGKSSRHFIRENLKFLEELIGISSDGLAHGLANDVWGVTVSRSLGVGRLVPGMGAYNEGQSPTEFTGNLAFGLAGPTGGVAKFAMTTAMGWNDKSFAELMTRAPGAFGNVSTAWVWATQGAATPDGAQLFFDANGIPREPTTAEIVQKAFGFQSTELAHNRAVAFEQIEAKNYWLMRRQRVMRDFEKAARHDDREGLADARQALREFREELPKGYESLAIDYESLRSAIEARRRGAAGKEQGLPVQKRYAPVYRDIHQAYQ